MLHCPQQHAQPAETLAGANEDIGVKRGALCYELDLYVGMFRRQVPIQA